jgi:hypothetical protein
VFTLQYPFGEIVFPENESQRSTRDESDRFGSCLKQLGIKIADQEF